RQRGKIHIYRGSRSNIVISRIFSAYFLGLPLISAANAEEDWAFFGDSAGQTRRFAKGRKASFPATAAAAQVARSCLRSAALESLAFLRSFFFLMAFYERDLLDARRIGRAPGGDFGVVLERVVDKPPLIGIHRFN